MLERLMFWAILGHFVGDYLLQSKATALGKSAPGWKGAWICLVHCSWYTIVVCLSVQYGTGLVSFGVGWSGWVVPMVFLSHYPIDRWSLTDKWLKLIGGRRLTDGVVEGWGSDTANVEVLGRVAAQQAFAAIVDAVVDNVLHVLLMLGGFAALLHWRVIG